VRAGGYLPGGGRRFFAKRARRILPPYYAAIVLALLLIPLPVTARDIVSHLFLVHNLSPATFITVNGAFWSIAVECQIYLWFPLFVWAWRRFGMPASVGLYIPFALLLSRASQNTQWYGSMPHLYALFTLGTV